jgi:hypothetical protein
VTTAQAGSGERRVRFLGRARVCHAPVVAPGSGRRTARLRGIATASTDFIAALPHAVRMAAHVLGSVASLALVAFVVAKAAHGVSLSRARPLLLVGAFSCALVTWLGLGLGWAALTGSRRPLAAVRTWARTQVLRYLPGGIWAPVARATRVEGDVLGKAGTVVAESAATLASAVATGGTAFALGGREPLGLLGLAAPVLVIGLAHVLPARIGVPARRVAAASGCYLVAWTAYAAAAVLAQDAIGPDGPVLAVAGASLLAWAAGFLVVFAPSGIGAREVAYLALLAGELPRDRLAAGALAARVALTLAEFTVLAAVLAALPRAKGSNA